MNKITSKFNFFSKIQNLIKQNIKAIIFFALIILIVIAGLQIYFFYKNEKILELSIAYNDSIYSNSQTDFIEDMNEIAETKSFYGLLASLELIKNKIDNNKYNESYEDYLKLLNNKKMCVDKVNEEINELLEAIEKNDNQVHEAADVLYHLLVLLENSGIKIEDVMEELKKRQNAVR